MRIEDCKTGAELTDRLVKNEFLPPDRASNGTFSGPKTQGTIESIQDIASRFRRNLLSTDPNSPTAINRSGIPPIAKYSEALRQAREKAGELNFADRLEAFGLDRKAGVFVPVWHLQSEDSMGCGDFGDLIKMVEWANKAGLEILQILPINDVIDPCPFAAISSFAIDPKLFNFNSETFKPIFAAAQGAGLLGRAIPQAKKSLQPGLMSTKDIESLPAKERHLGTIGKRIKPPATQKTKLLMLRMLFDNNIKSIEASSKLKDHPFQIFCEKNKDWLEAYALFRTITERHLENGTGPQWEQWNANEKTNYEEAKAAVEQEDPNAILFHSWVQWLLREQVNEVKEAAQAKGVHIMGDVPVGISRHSAEVWQDHLSEKPKDQKAFNLDYKTACAPDCLSDEYQIWGHAPLNADSDGVLSDEAKKYLGDKFRHQSEWFKVIKIDHLPGYLRTIVVPANDSDGTNARFFPNFNPGDQQFFNNGQLTDLHRNRIKEYARQNLGIIKEATERNKTLVIAEGFGSLDAQYGLDANLMKEVEEEFAIPGLYCPYWNTSGNGHVIKPEEQPLLAATMDSNHDTTKTIDKLRDPGDNKDAVHGRFAETGRVEADEFKHLAQNDEKLVRLTRDSVVDSLARSSSIFAIAPLSDLQLFCVDPDTGLPAPELYHPHWRQNVPGTPGVRDYNWSTISPLTMEEMLNGKGSYMTRAIKRMVTDGQRLASA